jgi:hypothetical protein
MTTLAKMREMRGGENVEISRRNGKTDDPVAA